MEPLESRPTENFEFVKLLAEDLSKGDLELPSFPDIVIRIRQSLEDERSTTEQIVQLLGAEPALAARVLRIANSSAFSVSTGTPITDLNTGVNRIGRSLVRSAAMSFAVTQMQNAYKLEAIRTHLNVLWDQCAHVAALCHVLARKFTKLNPDEALFIGLMHGIGKIYILGRVNDHPDFFQDEENLLEIMNEWHSAIGSMILDGWGFPDYVSAAIRDYMDPERQHENDTDYTDILIIAQLLSRFVKSQEDTELQLANVSACGKLRLTATDMLSILQQSDQQISSLRQALKG